MKGCCNFELKPLKESYTTLIYYIQVPWFWNNGFGVAQFKRVSIPLTGLVIYHIYIAILLSIINQANLNFFLENKFQTGFTDSYGMIMWCSSEMQWDVYLSLLETFLILTVQ